MKQFVDQFLQDYEKTDFKMTDEITGVEYSVMDIVANLAQRIKDLETESIETSNQLYELHNKIEMLGNQS
jgi:hypothetical protein